MTSITQDQREELAEIAGTLDAISLDIEDEAERRAVEVLAEWVFSVASGELIEHIREIA